MINIVTKQIYKDIADCILSMLDNEVGEGCVKELIVWKNDLSKADINMKEALQEKIEYAANMYDKCPKCGSTLQVRRIKEIHTELDDHKYENYYEKYCDCGVEQN